MKLSTQIVISSKKLKKYLLVHKKKNDKSKWLAKVGYNLENWQILKHDLRNLTKTNEAVKTDYTTFGQMYEIRGLWVGPNGKTIHACTIWMNENETNKTKFITMFPDTQKY